MMGRKGYMGGVFEIGLFFDGYEQDSKQIWGLGGRDPKSFMYYIISKIARVL